MALEQTFPRDLNPLERELLLWLLPADRPGYAEYRTLVDGWKVAGRGRRGEGNFILAQPTVSIDNESPLPQILAYGVVETVGSAIAVTLRERLGDQLEFEIVTRHGESFPEDRKEIRRWTYSTWLPGQPCPICSGALREVEMRTDKGRKCVLALCKTDERIWVFDEANGVNHPIPLTNFYNELMLSANIRDPNIALNSKRLFTDLQKYSDQSLSRTFASYNKLKTKIVFEDNLQITGEGATSWFRSLRARILKSD